MNVSRPANPHRFKRPLGITCLLTAAISLKVPAMQAQRQVLPDAPSAIMGYSLQTLSPAPQQQQPANPLPPDIAAPTADTTTAPPPCDKQLSSDERRIPWTLRSPSLSGPCHRENPLQEIISARDSPPLTPELKGFLAIRNVADPFNLLTIVGYSGIYVAFEPHSAYGPGFKGWGRLAGYSTLEDSQSEFFGTFAIPSIVHEDPRYHRMPQASIKRRIGHALIHTVWTQHDDGTPMINYATLLTYPISDELSNLYVPGLSTNASSTAKRIAAGYATDPISPLIAEFLPDIAKHIHIRIAFAQQILQQVANNSQNKQ
jgi:hypothetical protein